MRTTADAATLEPSTTPDAAVPNIVHSVADELIKLKRLQDDGVLTPEEFQTEKAKLLAR